MEKLVILHDGTPITEYLLTKPEVSIGRDPGCDIPLDEPGISRHHCRLLKVFNNFFVEDLKSTNGTVLNSHNVTKHILKHDDVIQIGQYTLRYSDPSSRPAVHDDEDDPDKTVIMRPVDSTRPNVVPPQHKVTPKTAIVRYFKGPKQGKSDKIERSLYTIGHPGGQVAAIARRAQGFFLLHIGGESYPKINSKTVESTRGVQLHEGDVVEVGENLAEISF